MTAAANRVTGDRARQLIALRLASPKRAEASAPIERQHNTGVAGEGQLQ